MFTLTPRAAKHVDKILELEGIKNYAGGMRFGVKTVESSGYEYFCEPTREDRKGDHIMILGGVRVLVDKKSFEIMRDVCIDLHDNLQEGFMFHNPLAKAACGCGMPFELKNEQK